MHLLFLPAFSISDCSDYYEAFLTGLGALHTVQFLQLDGYTHSGRRCLGDVHLSTLVEECLRACTRLTGPYILVGHSTGAVLVDHLYPRLSVKPVSVIVFNPLVRPPRLRVCGRIPLFLPVLRLLERVPVPLITHVFKGDEFGTACDVAPPMKYKLWIDFLSSSAKTLSNLPPSTTTILLGRHDKIGNGGDTSGGGDLQMVKYPGHASFRSLRTMSYILSILQRV
jgi:hypothetical protein